MRSKKIFLNIQVQLKYSWTYLRCLYSKWHFAFECFNYSALQKDVVMQERNISLGERRQKKRWIEIRDTAHLFQCQFQYMELSNNIFHQIIKWEQFLIFHSINNHGSCKEQEKGEKQLLILNQKEKKKNSSSASGFIYKYSRHKKNHSTFKWLSGS